MVGGHNHVSTTAKTGSQVRQRNMIKLQRVVDDLGYKDKDLRKVIYYIITMIMVDDGILEIKDGYYLDGSRYLVFHNLEEERYFAIEKPQIDVGRENELKQEIGAVVREKLATLS